MLIFSVSFQIDQMPEGKEKKEKKRVKQSDLGAIYIPGGRRSVHASKFLAAGKLLHRLWQKITEDLKSVS